MGYQPFAEYESLTHLRQIYEKACFCGYCKTKKERERKDCKNCGAPYEVYKQPAHPVVERVYTDGIRRTNNQKLYVMGGFVWVVR